MNKGELFSEQSNLNDSIFKKQSPYHTLSGKAVYSHGGIMPDIFVPADTAEATNLVQQLNDNLLFTAFVIDQLQPIINKYASAEDFVKQYQVSDDTFGDFIQYASGTIKEMDSNDIAQSRQPIKIFIKAYAARFKWGDQAYYQTINDDDAGFKKAIAAVK